MTNRKKAKKKAKRTWQDIAKDAQDHRDSTIAQVKTAVLDVRGQLPKNVMHVLTEMLPSYELELARISMVALLGKLSSGKISATDVTRTFLRQAGLAQGLVSVLQRNSKKGQVPDFP